MMIKYVTSNKAKFEEARLILANWQLEQVNLDLLEIQGESDAIIKAKAKDALRILNVPLIVEDVSMRSPALGGLPGPYVKDFLCKMGARGLCELIHKYDDHRVQVFCHVAFIKPNMEPVVFEGMLEGTAVAPRGGTRHGVYCFNTCFQPMGSDKTFGEMTMEQLSTMSMRNMALVKLNDYLLHLFPVLRHFDSK